MKINDWREKGGKPTRWDKKGREAETTHVVRREKSNGDGAHGRIANPRRGEINTDLSAIGSRQERLSGCYPPRNPRRWYTMPCMGLL